MPVKITKNRHAHFFVIAGFWLAFVIFLFPATQAIAAEPDLSRAEALMKEGKAAEAFALLEPFEDKYAGDVKYDYLLGLAALDSGKPDKATLAFERVLAVDPDFAGGRFNLARAYFQFGDTVRARIEFETLLGQNPLEATRVAAARYLEAIARREKAKQTVLSAYVEATVGHDSNVNNSTSLTQVVVPALIGQPQIPGGVITLASTNVKAADSYGLLGLGADVAHEVNPGFAVFAGASGRYRANSSADGFDYKSVDVRGGVALSGETDVVRATAYGERYYLDHAANRNLLGVGVDWRHVINSANHVNFFGQYSRYRFETGDITINNFNQHLLGLGWLRLFHDGRSALSANVFFGKEKAVNDRADGGKDIIGARVGKQLNLRDNLDFFVSVSVQKGSYDKENVAFLKLREDKQYDAVIGLTWRISDLWSLRPQVLHVSNDSNISIYAYKRTDVSITLRRDFR